MGTIKPNTSYTTTINVHNIQFYDIEGKEINMNEVSTSGNRITAPRNAEYLDFRRTISKKEETN